MGPGGLARRRLPSEKVVPLFLLGHWVKKKRPKSGVKTRPTAPGKAAVAPPGRPPLGWGGLG